jgi:hypothetical protein
MFDLVPDKKKAKFHKNLLKALLGIYAAVDGIDFAVLDGTYFTRALELHACKEGRREIPSLNEDFGCWRRRRGS